MHPYPLDEYEHEDLEHARAMARVMDDESETLRISEEDEALQACADAIFHDSEIRAWWGFPERRP